jgi:hypothetical protein
LAWATNARTLSRTSRNLRENNDAAGTWTGRENAPDSFSLSHDHENVAEGSFSAESVEVRRIELPRGLSDFELSVCAEGDEMHAAGLSLHIAKMDDFQVGDIQLMPDK